MDDLPHTLPTEWFRREDDSPDRGFYADPRLVAHIDDGAISAVRQIYGELLPPGVAVLDLMSSYYSHLPPELEPLRVAGLGLNAVELEKNPALTDYVVHDLNADPRIPFGDAEFGAAVVTVSIQYLIEPVAVFRDLARVLQPGAPFVVTYSHRMFPTKAVRIWLELGMRDRARLIATYFELAGGFADVSARECPTPPGGDPLFAVWARRA